MFKGILVLFCALHFLFSSQSAEAQNGTLLIAVSANLQYVFPELVNEFNRANEAEVKLSVASSGALFAQISNGAPFDLFFSANMLYPQKLYEMQLTANGRKPFVYAYGTLALFVPRASPLDLKDGIAALKSSEAKRLAVANPRLAPYGAAAIQLLKGMGIYERMKKNLLMGENVSQAFHFATAGGADAALLPVSLVQSPKVARLGRYITIPQNLYDPIAQSCVMIKNTPNKDASQAFLEFVRSKTARSVFKKFGYSVREPL